MKMSVREARAQFAAALAAVENGERVVITKNGEPVAELGPPAAKPEKTGFQRMRDEARKRGWDKVQIDFDPEFDDPAYSRKVLGLDS